MLRKKIFFIILFFGSVFFLFAWLTNLIIVYPEWNFLQIDYIVIFFEKLQKLPPFNLLGPIYLIKIDLSTITTFLFLITFLFSIKGLYLKITHNLHEVEENFPFCTNYKNNYIQLGLLGTLWNFIIVFKNSSSNSASVLLLKLGNALWSIFTAVVLITIICPSIFEKLIFRDILGIISPDN